MPFELPPPPRCRDHSIRAFLFGMQAAKLVEFSPLAVVIDDDPQAAEALGLTVRDWGAEVIVASTAAEALAGLGPQARGVSWVITDFELAHGVKGVDDVKALLAAAPKARVLVLSAAYGSGEAAARAGFDNMSKPADAAHIHAWLALG